MSFNNIKAMLGLSLAVGAMTVVGPAQAADYIIESTVAAPTEIIMPAATTTTVERTVVVPQDVLVPTSAVVERTFPYPSAVIVPTTESYVEKRTMIQTNAPAVKTSSAAIVQSSPALPSFSTRLSNLRTQIDNAAARGWITELRADELRQRCTNLAILNDNMLRNGFSRVQSEQLERDTNSLNIAVSGSMKTPSIGSAPQFYE